MEATGLSWEGLMEPKNRENELAKYTEE